MAALDTLTFVRRLEKAGVPREQAEAYAEATLAFMAEEVASKGDIEILRRDIEAVRRDVQKAEARLRSEIRELDLRANGKID